MGRIAYYVHDRGRGHATRSVPIIRALVNEGHEVHVCAGEAVSSLMHDEAWGLTRIKGLRPGLLSLVHLATRTREDESFLRTLEPDLLVSDGDAPSLQAGRRLGLKTVAVGHGLVFSHCKLKPGLPRLSVLLEKANTLPSSWGADRVVAVHFMPIEGTKTHVHTAGPDWSEGLDGLVTHEPFILSYFRDANGAAILREACGEGLKVRCYGDLQAPPAGVTLLPPSREGFLQDLRACSGVIGSAGSNLISECMYVGKPMLAMYRNGEREPRMNALLLEEAGLGVATAFQGDLSAGVSRFIGMMNRTEHRGRETVTELPPASRVVAQIVRELLAP
jgi:UDP-N-acetylglucosamine--N-acetylmuramyl-(pentapeptide) pyrophosphoryl-undecaprenol N-acetylglucosamine transferase